MSPRQPLRLILSALCAAAGLSLLPASADTIVIYGASGRVWAHALVLDNYRATTDVEWTVASPSGSIGPGERTGRYRLGENDVLLDENGGESGISEEDYAVALIDEVENPRAIRRRIAVGY